MSDTSSDTRFSDTSFSDASSATSCSDTGTMCSPNTKPRFQRRSDIPRRSTIEDHIPDLETDLEMTLYDLLPEDLKAKMAESGSPVHRRKRVSDIDEGMEDEQEESDTVDNTQPRFRRRPDIPHMTTIENLIPDLMNGGSLYELLPEEIKQRMELETGALARANRIMGWSLTIQ